MDLFDKCRNFTRADDIKASGFYPYFRPIEESEGPVVQIEGRKIVMAGSNNYLGLTSHPKVKEAAIKAIEKYGTGCSGSRYLTGTIDLHEELEDKLAKFFGKEKVLLFSTGYQTAQGIIPTLVQRNEYVISDRDNHASIVAGNLMSKGITANVVRYKHSNMDDLERVLKKIPLESGKLIDDNVKLFDEYSEKFLLEITPLLMMKRRMLMTYRVWVCRKFIPDSKKQMILERYASKSVYMLMPLVGSAISLEKWVMRRMRNFHL